MLTPQFILPMHPIEQAIGRHVDVAANYAEAQQQERRAA